MNQLMALYGLNRNINGRRFEVVRNAASNEATLYIYDVIVGDALTAEWYGGIDAMTFIKTLMGIDAETIHLRINSPGGDVFAARAIEQSIKEHPANIIAHIDGVAASAATYIAIAADKVIAQEGAMFMIHNAWTYAAGDRNDFVATADLLGKIDGTLATTYAAKTGKTADEISALMDAETWFTAQEAIDFGFIDALDQAADKKSTSALWNMSVYRNAPKPETIQESSGQEKTPNFAAMLRHVDLLAAVY